ncbi:MAG: peptide-methionine (S)-S-oxide reductase MsrA [Crocinitomicaceae bacterium]|jgi:peptide-methionine (S)-S-oxide reductase|nr:peptide-methionine (S)-S-oxide reductase MsrA [Crocinitomicaceae bacterium]
MIKTVFTISLLSISVFIGSCQSKKDQESTTKNSSELRPSSYAYFSSGCFWCVEAIFERVEGVTEAVSGYSGGTEKNPTYQNLGSHAETVMVLYDSNVVDFPTLLKVYYGSQNPTTIGQKPDFGSHYRSIIFYQNNIEKQFAENYKAMLDDSKKYDNPVITEVMAFEKFWKAEEYHQNYEKLHPNETYVKSVSIPRLQKFQRLFPKLLKKSH